MPGILRAGMLSLLGLVLTTAAWADLAPSPGRPRPPRPTPPAPVEKVSKATAPVVVKHADLAREGEGVQAKIVIPRKLLAELAPAAAAAPAPTSQSSFGGTRSIVAGVMLSLAAVSLVFVARGSKLAKGTAAVGLIAGLMLAGSSLMADIRVPGQPFTPNGPVRPRPAVPGEAAKVILEVTEDGDAVVLTLPAK